MLTAGNDDRPVHDASTLLSMIGQLCQLLDGNSSDVANVESWLVRLCKEQTVGECSIVRCVVLTYLSHSLVFLDEHVCQSKSMELFLNVSTT